MVRGAPVVGMNDVSNQINDFVANFGDLDQTPLMANQSAFRNQPDVTGQFEDALLRDELDQQNLPEDISMIGNLTGLQDQTKNLINISDFSLKNPQFPKDDGQNIGPLNTPLIDFKGFGLDNQSMEEDDDGQENDQK